MNQVRRKNNTKKELVMLTAPFAIACGVIEKTSPIRIIVRQSQQRIEFLTYGDDRTTFFSKIEHSLREQMVVLGIQYQQLFVPWPEYRQFFRMADKCIDTLMKLDESALPGYVVPIFNQGVLAMQYLVPVSYAALSNQEYADKLQRAFLQTGEAIGALMSVVDALISREGETPSEEECMRGIYKGRAAYAQAPRAEDAAGTLH